MERAMGIEPTSLAWEARVIPLYDARVAWQLSTRCCRAGKCTVRKHPRLHFTTTDARMVNHFRKASLRKNSHIQEGTLAHK